MVKNYMLHISNCEVISNINTHTLIKCTFIYSSTRQKSAKIPVVKATATIAEDKESLEVQEFIAAEYPHVENSVSSTVRLGRALVSGALGRRTDDPKIFGAAVSMTECSVRIQTTRKKAKAPVSAAPPNSIDSEADTEGMGDSELSLSATDLCTQIDLPEGGTEMEMQGIHTIKDATIAGGIAAGNPNALEIMTGPVLSYAADETIVSGCSATQDLGIPDKQCSPIEPVTPRSVILADFNLMMGEIDAANLLQEELIRTEPQLASAYSFMNIVSGGKPTNIRRSALAAERSPHTAIEDAGAVVGVNAAANVTTEMPSGPSLRDVKFAERQRLTRITAAKSLLEEELRKKNPSIVSVATFHREAYGEGGHQDGVDEADAAVTGAGCDVGLNPGVVPLCPTISREAAIVPLETVQCAEVSFPTRKRDIVLPTTTRINTDQHTVRIGEQKY